MLKYIGGIYLNKLIVEDKYEFFHYDIGKARIYFSTAKGNLDFNINKPCGEENIKNIKRWFSFKEVSYLKQIHSDLIYNYDGEIHQGDALITDIKDIAIGIFTADCVPILIYDIKLDVIAAIHSGWKGAFNQITSKTIDKMRQEYGSNPRNLKVFIGPHNRECCYEIGEELKKQFSELPIYRDKPIFNGNNLSIEKCIMYQLVDRNVPKENIMAINICTYCNKECQLFSYRKAGDKSGRMFSFIYMDK